jgi:uncharacterized protein
MKMLDSLPANTAAAPMTAPLDAARTACSRMAPLWPLQDFVAVNPFVGLADKPFTEACDLMHKLVPGGMQMPLPYYAEKLKSGALKDADLQAALTQAAMVLPAEHATQIKSWTPDFLKSAIQKKQPETAAPELQTVAEALDFLYQTQWAELVTESIGQFCAAYFDEVQSAWRMPWKSLPLYQAWKEYAALDASLEARGITALRSWVKALPDKSADAIAQLLPGFRLEGDPTDFLHKQLMTIRGWAGHIQYRARTHGADAPPDELLDLLTICLALDAALLAKFDSPAFQEFWPTHQEEDQRQMLLLFLLQLADEHAWLQGLTAKLNHAGNAQAEAQPLRPALQAVFCIDVRSEVFRRALESASPEIQTLGFAGFFGMPIATVPFGQRDAIAQCPVLLQPKYRIQEKPGDLTAETEQEAIRRKRLNKRIKHSWNSFKTSAITCFSFVETAGIGFGAKLFRNTFAPADHAAGHCEHCAPVVTPDANGSTGIPLPDRIALGRGALKNMGITRDFARLVLLCGHGSSTTNNPYAASLDCGACGGHAGDVNARICASILNDAEVRQALASEGVIIPQDTWFLAGLHNTTTDEVTLLDTAAVPQSHQEDLKHLEEWLLNAGARARCERATLLGISGTEANLKEKIIARSRDWSQVRPEWGLAGNAAFIAAPRARTRSVDLGGRVFLHNYDAASDADGSILELILCAPMVVASWINLQYLASTVNNAAFGSGNKVIHNIVGTLGVCLGNGGDLQTGLPLQSVHDGKRWIHEPLRLHVLVEAPRESIDAVLAKHEHVRHLIEHGWVLLFAIEDEGKNFHQRLPNQQWQAIG